MVTDISQQSLDGQATIEKAWDVWLKKKQPADADTVMARINGLELSAHKDRQIV